MSQSIIGRVYSGDVDFGQTLWSVLSELTRCEVLLSPNKLPSIHEEMSGTFLVIIALDLKDSASVKEVISWFREYKKTSLCPKVVVIAANKCADLQAIEMETCLVKEGVYEVMDRPVNLRHLRYVIETLEAKYRFASRNKAKASSVFQEKMLAKINKVKDFDTNIFLTGETGVGKSFWARKIHEVSARKNQPFVAINCANYSEALAQSQLFGHVKGAFTGAESDQKGLLESSGHGTVFLDETDSLQIEVQAKLLHVIEERQFRKLGGNKLIPMNSRILCATNKILDDMVANGTFRSDLFYRLNAYEINIPPLRERVEEIEDFCEIFGNEFAKTNKCKKTEFKQETMELLRSYPWPGNLRELRNCIHHCAIESECKPIEIEHLPKRILTFFDNSQLDAQPEEMPKLFQGRDEENVKKRRKLIHVLTRNGFSRQKTAEEMGVSRMTIYNQMRKLELS